MHTERLLVIDDNKEALCFLEELLGNRGYTVVTAQGGAEGLLRAKDDKPDVILVDMHMPNMTGLDVIEALNQNGQHVPTILMTAHGSEELAVKALRSGASDYISKPCEPEAVLKSVEQALEHASLRRQRGQRDDQFIQTNQTVQRQSGGSIALPAIDTSVTSSSNPDQVSARFTEAAAFMVQGEESSLMLLEPDGELYLRAAKRAGEKSARNLHVRSDDHLAGRVVDTGRPLLLDREALKRSAAPRLAKALIMAPLRLPERGVIGVLEVAKNISERPFSEHDLQLLCTFADCAAIALSSALAAANFQQEQHGLEAILGGIREAVLVVNEQGHVVLTNEAARRAFRWVGGDVVGRSVQEVIPYQELLELLAQPPGAGLTWQTAVPLADGHTLSACIHTISGVGYAILMHDITPFIELDRIKSGLISTVSHDLRTPLTTIQGYIDLLPHAGPLTEQQQEFIARVQRSMSAITRLVSDLLEIGHIETGFDFEMVMIDLQPIITEAVSEFLSAVKAKEQSLQVRLPENLSQIRGNPRRLCQVVSNLVDNAVKYTPPHGHIVVEVTQGEHYTTISVTDDGLGIPVDDQPFVFDKFFRVDLPETLDIPGTGLGLSIVKSVVEKHGGRVWLESTPGEGSTFILLLPMS